MFHHFTTEIIQSFITFNKTFYTFQFMAQLCSSIEPATSPSTNFSPQFVTDIGSGASLGFCMPPTPWTEPSTSVTVEPCSSGRARGGGPPGATRASGPSVVINTTIVGLGGALWR